MTVVLDKPIKRQVEIDGKPYTLTLGPESVTIVRKGARKGPCVTWASILEGTPQLRSALARSIEVAERGGEVRGSRVEGRRPKAPSAKAKRPPR